MRKLTTMSVIAMMSVGLSVEVEALPLDSAILAQSEMEKPALCETRKVVTRDMYPDDPQKQSPLYLDDVDRQAQEGGTLLLSFMDYGSTVNPDLNGYSTYISSVCIDFAQRMAEGACAIERKWILPMNQYLIVKPKSAQLKARIFTMVGRYNETLVNWRFFEQAEPAMPKLFQVLEYQIACDGNGSATKIVVDKIP